MEKKTLKLGTQFRDVEILHLEASRGGTSEGGRFPIAISSEYPVERWFGMEILDHGAGSVDLSRFADGAAVLVNHDTADQVGVLEDCALGADRVLRGTIRFGRSARAQEIQQDIQDGIRRHISVGYRVLQMKIESTDAGTGLDTYRVTRWLPMETSVVPVPADPTVGAGRGADEGGDTVEVLALETAPHKATAMERSVELNAAAPVGAITTVERGEAAEIVRLGGQHGMQDKVGYWLERGTPLSDVRKEVLEKVQAEFDRKVEHASRQVTPIVELTEKEAKTFSICRAIVQHIEKRDGFESEVSRAIAQKLQREPTGIYIPTSTRATLVAGTASIGGSVVFQEQREFIELLRAEMCVVKAGARLLSGLTGNLAFPRQLTAATLYWPGEAPGSATTASNMTMDQLTMTPTAAQATTSYSRQLLAQSTPDIDSIVRQDLAAIHAQGYDIAAINGTASSQPRGVLSVSGIGSVTMGTNGAVVTFPKLVDLETNIANSSALRGSLAYLTTPGQRGYMKQTQKFATTNGVAIWENGELNGYPAFASANVPSNLTKGTSTTICSAVIFGNFQEIFIGDWGAFEIIPDIYTLADKNSVKLTTIQLVDVGVRHAASFAAIKDAL